VLLRSPLWSPTDRKSTAYLQAGNGFSLYLRGGFVAAVGPSGAVLALYPLAACGRLEPLQTGPTDD
jgi:hypothetical protein